MMLVLGAALLSLVVAFAAWYGGILIEQFIMSDKCWTIVRRLTFSVLALMFLSGLARVFV